MLKKQFRSTCPVFHTVGLEFFEDVFYVQKTPSKLQKTTIYNERTPCSPQPS